MKAHIAALSLATLALALPAQAQTVVTQITYRTGGGWYHGGEVYAEPVYINAPPPPPRVAYFCSAYQQYYPNVASCPVPWQMVSY
ncbi:MAG: hypothetical protein EBT70_02655 [Betaproteobacteria bacterium]|nr:hypothetical protein [Betaproteobacteria bacterium]